MVFKLHMHICCHAWRVVVGIAATRRLVLYFPHAKLARNCLAVTSDQRIEFIDTSCRCWQWFSKQHRLLCQIQVMMYKLQVCRMWLKVVYVLISGMLCPFAFVGGSCMHVITCSVLKVLNKDWFLIPELGNELFSKPEEASFCA